MKGRCLCNGVQFELRSDVQESYYCHCQDCQTTSGSAFHVFAVVTRGSVVLVQGRPAEFRHNTASGYEMTREFCPDCGTPLFARSSRFPEIQMVLISALENSELMKPSFQNWCASKVPWSNPGDEVISFAHGALDDN